MAFALSLSPIALILFLMVGLRWSATRAGATGYLLGMGLAWGVFGATPALTAVAHGKALLFTLDVLLIIWAAFLLYRVVDEAGAIHTIGLALPKLTPDLGLQTLIIGWVFASFLQGVGGFGVPVAVTAPLLVTLGLPPLTAVVVPSIGHGWGVTFGSMASSFLALMAATGQPATALAPPAALFLALACPLTGWMIAHAIGGWSEVRRLFLPVLTWGAVMGLAQVIFVHLGFWNIGGFLAGLCGLLATPLVVRLVGKSIIQRGKEAEIQGRPGENTSTQAILTAISGYAILIGLTLLLQAVPPVKAFVNQVAIQITFPEVTSLQGFVTPAGMGRRISPFGHTGSILAYASLLAYMIYRQAGRYSPGAGRRILTGMLKRVLPASTGILLMICLAGMMEHTGMTDTLARGLADGTGRFFPLAAPWIGALGAFITGSNTNSNVMFGALQYHTAELLALPAALILAAQTSGAALASVLSPAKVVVGVSTVGLSGQEGQVMRSLAIYAALLIMFISLLACLAICTQGP